MANISFERCDVCGKESEHEDGCKPYEPGALEFGHLSFRTARTEQGGSTERLSLDICGDCSAAFTARLRAAFPELATNWQTRQPSTYD